MENNANPYQLIRNEVVVDISMLYDVAGNDEAYIRLMAETFLKTVPVTLETIENSYKAKDYDNVYYNAHKLKSSLSVVKINDMLTWLKEVEQLAKQKTDDPALAERIKKIRTRFEVARELLSKKFLF